MKKTAKRAKQKTSLAIDPVLWRQLRVQALQEGRPAYDLLDDLIRTYLKAKGATR